MIYTTNEELLDFLQSLRVLYNIKKGKHPTIKPDDLKASSFEDWFNKRYFESGKIDEFMSESR